MAAPMQGVSLNRKRPRSKALISAQEDASGGKKTKESPFNEIEFKYYLKEPETTILGFEKFLTATKSLTERAEDDIIHRYCRSSPECSEIFQVLEAGTLKKNQLQLVFSCFEKILLRIADDLSQFYTTGQTVVKKLLAGHIHAIFNSLNVKNNAYHIKTSLKLLVAMVMLGAPSAKLVLNNVDLGHKEMLLLLQRRDVKDEEDVRTCFIHLIVACLLARDNDVIRKLVQTKGLMENVFQGVQYDRVGVLQLLLTTVLEKVIRNTGISKTTKVRMFSVKGLKELGHLYNWQGLAKWKASLKQKGKQLDSQRMEVDDTVSEDKAFVAELADQFLTEVCTSFKHGIIFHDNTYGFSGRSQNHLMTSFLGYLSGQLGHVLVQKLVIGILTACPDQLQYFLSNITQILVPRETSKWKCTMDFLVKIYRSLGKNISILKSREKRSVGDFVQILHIYTVPVAQVFNTVLPGLKDKSLAVNHVTLGLIRQIADTAGNVLRIIEMLTVYSETEKREIHSLYKAFVLKNLPDVLTVFTCWDKAMTVQNSNHKDLDSLQELCNASLSDVLTQIEQILCLYQDFQQALLSEHPVILGKLIDGVMGSKPAENCGTGHMTKVYLLKLMAGTDTRRLPWAKKNASGHSLLYQLFDMLTQLSASEELVSVTQQLVCKLLEGTGQFEGQRDDLLVWIESLQDSDSCVLDFVSMVMMTYIRNPYPYMDKLCDLDLQSDFSFAQDKRKTQQISVQDIIAMDTIDLGEEDTEDCSKNTTIKRFPFCPVLIVALEMLEKLGTVPESLKEYISQVVLHIFHQQVDPFALCSLVKRYKCDIFLTGLHRYILTWTETEVGCPEGALTELRYQELQAENEGILRTDKEPISTIQQNLLHLTYQIQGWNRSSSIQYVKQMKSTKKTIVTSVKDICLAENDQKSLEEGKEVNRMAEGNGIETHLQDLIEGSSQQLLSSAVRLVLGHPISKQFFLHEETVNDDNQSTKISKIVTDMVIDMLKTTSEENVDLADILDFYFERISSHLQSATRNDHFSKDTILKVLTVFVPKFTVDQCRMVFDLVLNASFSDSEEEDVLLLPLVTGLIQKLSESDCKIVKLSEKGSDRLINWFLNSEMPPEVLYKFFQRFPLLSSQFSERSLERLVLSSKHSRLVQFVMENNVAVTSRIGEMIHSMDLDWTTSENLSVVLKYVKAVVMNPEYDVNQIKSASRNVVKVFKSELLSLCEKDGAIVTNNMMKLASLLIHEGLLGEKMTRKMQKRLLITSQDHEALKPHHIDLICLICGEGDRKTILQTCLKSLSAMYSKLDAKGTSQDKLEMEDKLLDILASCREEELQTLSAWPELPNVWPQFIKSSLKFAYTKFKALKFTTNMVPVLHRQSIDFGLSLEAIVTMVTSHSSFLPVMFQEKGQECQDILINLMSILTQLCPAACKVDHIGAFLGAYGASLSMTDQKIFKLLHFYEKNEIPLSDYKPFLWGEKGVEQHALRQSLGPSLKRATMGQVMSNIDPNVMTHSVLHFPLRRKIQDIEPQSAEVYKSDGKCYDPCFILPLISQLLEPECVIDCRRFIHSGCLGFTFAALSSHNEDIRTLAQHILDKFQSHLGMAKIPEREQLEYMIHVVQNSIPKSKNKLACIITQFLARTAKLMLKPDDHMYTIINQFLLLKPVLDIGNIPEFFKLFNSSAIQYQVERSWILTLMIDGLRESADYWIFEKRFAFKLLQSFYFSKLADTQSQCQVLQILVAACRERRLAVDLCQNHGFLIWIASAIEKLSVDKVQLCVHLCNLLDVVWTSVVEQSKGETRNAQVSFLIQILLCFKTVLFYVGDIPDEVKLQFLRNLSAVLSNLSSVEDEIRGQETQTVTHTEILLLLIHCQKNWTQSKCLTQSIKSVLVALGLNMNELENNNPQSAKRNESAVSQHKLEGETDNDKSGVVENLECDSKDKIRKKSLMVVEIVKILDLSKLIEDYRSEEKSTANVIIIRWILDNIGIVEDLGSIFCMARLVQRYILSGTENRLVLAYVSGENNTMATEIVVNILNMYNVITEKYYSMDKESMQLVEMKKAVEVMNEVLTEVYRQKFNISQRKIKKKIAKRLQSLKGCLESQELKSVILRQMFVEKC